METETTNNHEQPYNPRHRNSESDFKAGLECIMDNAFFGLLTIMTVPLMIYGYFESIVQDSKRKRQRTEEFYREEK